MSEIIDKIKFKLKTVKNQLMFQYNQGAELGKQLKESHKDKIRKIGKDKNK